MCIWYGVCLCADITIQFFKIHGSLTLSSQALHECLPIPAPEKGHEGSYRYTHTLEDLTFQETLFAFHESILLVPSIKGGTLLSWALSYSTHKVNFCIPEQREKECDEIMKAVDYLKNSLHWLWNDLSNSQVNVAALFCLGYHCKLTPPPTSPLPCKRSL